MDHGGDGVSHHRHTFDRVCTTNEFVGAEPIKSYDSARGISLNYPISFISFAILSPLSPRKRQAEREFDSLSLCLILKDYVRFEF